MDTDVQAVLECASALAQTADDVYFIPGWEARSGTSVGSFLLMAISGQVRDPEVFMLGVLPRDAGFELIRDFAEVNKRMGVDIDRYFTIPETAFVMRGAKWSRVDLASCARVDVEVTKPVSLIVGAPGGGVWAEAAVAGCGVATTTDLDGRVKLPGLPTTCTLAIGCGRTELKFVNLDPSTSGRVDVQLNAPERPDRPWDGKSAEEFVGVADFTFPKTCGSRMPSAPR